MYQLVSIAQNRAPNNAVVAESVVALVTRKDNPKNVTEWDDLTRYAQNSNLLPSQL